VSQKEAAATWDDVWVSARARVDWSYRTYWDEELHSRSKKQAELDYLSEWKPDYSEVYVKRPPWCTYRWGSCGHKGVLTMNKKLWICDVDKAHTIVIDIPCKNLMVPTQC